MSDYSKNYYKENSEKWKNVYNNTEEYREYQKNYYQENKEELSERNKEYLEDFIKEYDGKFIYFIFDELNELKYIGKTVNIYNRLTLHKYNLSKYNPNIDRVMYLDLTSKLSGEELADAEKYFIELFKLDLNESCGDYDTNIAFKLSDKDLILHEFKFKRDNVVKSGEVYEIESSPVFLFNYDNEEERERLLNRKLFRADDVLLSSHVANVNHYINLDISDEEYEIMAKRVKENYKDFDNALNFPVRKILFSLKNYKDITLPEKGQAINHYYNLLKGYSDEELNKILTDNEMSLYKKIKGIE